MQAWSAGTASTATSSTFPTPISYRGHRLLLLRFIRSLLRVKKYDDNVHEWLREVKCHVDEQKLIMALRMSPGAAQWFYRVFMFEVQDWHAHMFGMDGTLFSLMCEPIVNGGAQLLSAVVHGIGRSPVSMWTLGRMEWLALELVTEARQVLWDRMGNTDDALWKAIDEKLKRPREKVELSIGFAPHKMRLSGDELEASAPGAGERADVLLLAWPDDSELPSVLASAYHTTNVPPGTASKSRGQAYPETRILWRQNVPLPELLRLAACSLTERLGLPHPAPVAGLLDMAVWSSSVLQQAAVPDGVRQQGHDLSDTSDSESDSEL